MPRSLCRRTYSTILIGSLLIGLGACGEPIVNPPASAGLTVTIDGLPVGVDADVGVNGPDGFGIALTSSETLTGLAPGSYLVEAGDVVAVADTYVATVSDSPVVLVAGGAATVVVAYGAEADADPDPDAPTITGVGVLGYGSSTQVRQGAGGITFEVVGTNLGGLTDASLGDLSVQVITSDALGAVLEVVVPHGVDLGPRTLTVSAATGVATRPEAVLITPITAGPEGSDATGRGTPDDPYRSLTFAVAQAVAGDSVALGAGTYSAAHGESWPVELQDIELVGQSRASTILVGPDDTTDGLVLRGASRVAALTVTGFRVGVRAAAGTAVLDAFAADANALDGLLIASSAALESVDVSGSSFSENGRDGIRARSTSPGLIVTIAGSTIDGNAQQGVLASGSGELRIRDSILESNMHRGVALGGNVTLLLARTTVLASNLDGILASGSSTLLLDDVTVRASLGSGINFGGTGRLEMRDSRVINNLEDGVRLRNNPVVNLGDALEPGNNVITAVFFLGDLLADDRQANAVPTIVAFGNQLGDLEPPPTGSHSGPGATNTPYWRITNVGNVIDFGP